MADAGVHKHQIDEQVRPGSIVELAERQHGTVARWQLFRLGFGRGAIDALIRRGWLHPVHRGVYAVGHRVLTADGHRMAAVLSCGPRAVLSHRDAAAAWGLRHHAGSRFEVTLPFRRKPTPGIRAHYARLPGDEVTRVRGIPVTIVPRTILDAAASEPRRVVERLIHEAEVNRLTDRLSLPDLLARYPGRAGTPLVRAILEDRSFGAGVPKDVFTTAFLDFLDEYDLPHPELNVHLSIGEHLHEIDCLYREQRVAIELDGRAVHDTARAYEADRSKDRRLAVAELRPLRVTWRQLHRERGELAADLRSVLRSGRSR
jgi:hypothetical protein